MLHFNIKMKSENNNYMPRKIIINLKLVRMFRSLYSKLKSHLVNISPRSYLAKIFAISCF